MPEEIMSSASGQNSVFRFAPSPNGRLHLGHALSACLNFDMARAVNGRFLLRMEDIDLTRCTPELEQGIYDDLSWLGLCWEWPVRRQSEHFEDYHAALNRLIRMGLAYPSFLTRSEVKAFVKDFEASGNHWPRDPDGAPLYPPLDKRRSASDVAELLTSGIKHAWRLDMEKACLHVDRSLSWQEHGAGHSETVKANPSAWGDFILSRSDAPSSYHLSVVVDDALQGVTHVVRGMDLFHATSAHRLLQSLLELPVPQYHHHRLVLGENNRKLSKSEGSAALSALRAEGQTASDVRSLLGL